MVFVYPEEKKAVVGLSNRISEETKEYNGWNSINVLHPSLFKGRVSMLITPFRRPQQNVFLTELDKWKEYRNLLRSHHSFISAPKEFTNSLETQLGQDMSTYGAELGFVTREGVACCNFYNHDTQRRDAREITVFEVLRDGIWAQLITEASCLKILGIVNTGRAKDLRRWVRDLGVLAINKLGVDMLYGHPMRVASEDIYPCSSPGNDKRFEKWKTIELEIDGATESLELNRLYRLWLRMGFQLLFSPDEGQQLCVGLLSDEYRAKLLRHNEQAWKEILEKDI